MKLYQQNATGVGVYDGDQNYADTLAHFATDHGSAAPALPDGVDHRVYQPDVRHALNANNSTIDGGPLPWPTGDAIIAAIATLITNKAARLEAEAEAFMAANKAANKGA